MAKLANKLHVRKNGVTQECTCYTTAAEATPTTVQGGDCLEIKQSGVSAYLGLWPISTPSGSDFHTPLKCKKDNAVNIVETDVVNKYSITVVQRDPSLQELVIVDLTNSGQYTSNFSVNPGTLLQANVTALKEGYTTGAIIVTQNGVQEILPSGHTVICNGDMKFEVENATINSYLIQIESVPHQTITFKNVTSGMSSTGNTTANHGDAYKITITADEGYIAGQLIDVPATGTVTGYMTIKATAPQQIIRSLTMMSNEIDESFIINTGGQQIGLENGNNARTVNLGYGTEYSVQCRPIDQTSEIMFLKNYQGTPLKLKINFVPDTVKNRACVVLANNFLTTNNGMAEYVILSSFWRLLRLNNKPVKYEGYDLEKINSEMQFAISIGKPFEKINSITCVDEKGNALSVRNIPQPYYNYTITPNGTEKEITMTIEVAE